MELAAGFPSTTRDGWRRLAVEVLRKSGVEAESPEAALSRLTYDGIRIAPLYDVDDLPGDPGLPGAPPYVRGGRAVTGWDVRQRHAVAAPEAVLSDLENGVTSLWLVLGDGAIGVDELGSVLKDVYLDLAPVVLEAGDRTGEAAAALFALAAERGTAPSGNLGASSIGPGFPGAPSAGSGFRGTSSVGAGSSGAPSVGAASQDASSIGARSLGAELAVRCVAEFPGLRAITVDATRYHDAGGSDAEELGCSIAAGVAELRALTGAGLDVEQALGQIDFRYAATADQFATIAKLRAARLLWGRVAEVCGAAGHGGQRQHAVTSSAMMTARDPWVNLLRTTLACFAAGVGGADAVTVQPFDACLGLPDAFSRRIARNTQALLLEESGVGRVIDPAGGSWYVERRTSELAERAWAWFQEIEAAGGVEAAGPLIAARIADTRERRAADVAHRRFPITGVSEFPDIHEKPVRRPAEAASPAHAGGPAATARRPVEGGPVRYAAEFEALRDLADAQPERPKVFLATIGPVAAHTARAAFAANLFQAGGLATETAGPGADPEQIATAFAVSGSTVACLCSSDRLYVQHAAAVAAALRHAGARKVWLAGKGEYEGVDACLYAGCDALDVLRTTFDDLEVTR
ncbi:methylmalonyl-CoA mutase [Nonomuraea sp. NN258]|uniref:methylmalonyl-CoA mutase subunit beta n=1 Tax=Nonomuraea antri TaxID=2730852 RepID=UPI00156885C9|nr:methylmalonyl-CoA mutase subunit beta [Nonomuraea antri]NRQ40269.1 methylmalonyl-CoA mutase [Nonomuraea antri]